MHRRPPCTGRVIRWNGCRFQGRRSDPNSWKEAHEKGELSGNFKVGLPGMHSCTYDAPEPNRAPTAGPARRYRQCIVAFLRRVFVIPRPEASDVVCIGVCCC